MAIVTHEAVVADRLEAVADAAAAMLAARRLTEDRPAVRRAASVRVS